MDDSTSGSAHVTNMVGSVSERVSAALQPLAEVSVAQVFTEPVQSGDVVVIAAAAITKSGGFGFGAGGDDQPANGGGGGGGGGGGHVDGRPVAVIEITPEGTRVKPVIDYTRVGLTLLAGALGLWRASRRRR
jgi:uncharacterized spore protein YtfJ